MPRDLSNFLSDINELSGELLAELHLGVLPDLEEWNTFLNLFHAAHLLWWSNYRETIHAASPSSR